MVTLDAHPLLDAAAFITRFPKPIGSMVSPPSLLALLALDAEAPVSRSEEVRQAVRACLRHGGYRPTGRGKPASEYLVRAAGEGALSSINVAVDTCNGVSLQSGLPISVIDLDLTVAPHRVAVAPPGTSYVFNPAGQVMDVSGLLCLFDSAGPCANGVKDSQRTKTHADTHATLSIVWGSSEIPGRTQAVAVWYRRLLDDLGAETNDALAGA